MLLKDQQKEWKALLDEALCGNISHEPWALEYWAREIAISLREVTKELQTLNKNYESRCVEDIEVFDE